MSTTRLRSFLENITKITQIDQLPWWQQEARQILKELVPVARSPGKVYVVEDEFQYDGGSVILGIYEDANQALILQQKARRKAYAMYKSVSESVADRACRSIGIREIELNKDLFHEQ